MLITEYHMSNQDNFTVLSDLDQPKVYLDYTVFIVVLSSYYDYWRFKLNFELFLSVTISTENEFL